MTTQVARRTPFRLLVVMSDNGTSSEDLYLDDDVELKMGAEGGKWTFVQFIAESAKKIKVISSHVVNNQFAVSQKWVINRVTILGLRTGTNFHGYAVHTASNTRIGDMSRLRITRDRKDKFIVAEISDLDLLIGHEFKLVLY